jgi:hypothetical protein
MARPYGFVEALRVPNSILVQAESSGVGHRWAYEPISHSGTRWALRRGDGELEVKVHSLEKSGPPVKMPFAFGTRRRIPVEQHVKREVN